MVMLVNDMFYGEEMAVSMAEDQLLRDEKLKTFNKNVPKK